MIKDGCVLLGEPLTGSRPSGMEDGYQELIAAITRQAVKDYVSILTRLFSCPSGAKRSALEMEKTELEVFFYSEWFSAMTEIDGGRLIDAARRQAVEKAKEAIRRKQKKKLKAMEKAGTKHC